MVGLLNEDLPAYRFRLCYQPPFVELACGFELRSQDGVGALIFGGPRLENI